DPLPPGSVHPAADGLLQHRRGQSQSLRQSCDRLGVLDPALCQPGPIVVAPVIGVDNWVPRPAGSPSRLHHSPSGPPRPPPPPSRPPPHPPVHPMLLEAKVVVPCLLPGSCSLALCSDVRSHHANARTVGESSQSVSSPATVFLTQFVKVGKTS